MTAANGSVYCVADLVDSHRNISITLLVAVPALIVLLVLLDALGRLRRGSYEKYVKRWIKRRGAPGKGSAMTKHIALVGEEMSCTHVYGNLIQQASMKLSTTMCTLRTRCDVLTCEIHLA